MNIKPIAHIENDYDTKFAIPRQSCLVNGLKSKIVFEKEYSSPIAFNGLESFSHIWLIWEFDKNSHNTNSLTVRPPRLGGNKRLGVFATRSPYRPNPLGLSSVKLEEICNNKDGSVYLIVSGADLVNGTKIYDIKPYLSYSDCHTDAINGFGDEVKDYKINVEISKELLTKIEKDKQQAFIEILSSDPRPSYHNDNRVYGFKFSNKEIKFKVENNTLTVLEIYDE